MMAGKHGGSRPKFTIEDAFEEDPDDVVRMYGATTERSPLKPKGGAGMEEEEAAGGRGEPGSGKSLLVVPDVDVSSKIVPLIYRLLGDYKGWKAVVLCRIIFIILIIFFLFCHPPLPSSSGSASLVPPPSSPASILLLW